VNDEAVGRSQDSGGGLGRRGRSSSDSQYASEAGAAGRGLGSESGDGPSSKSGLLSLEEGWDGEGEGVREDGAVAVGTRCLAEVTILRKTSLSFVHSRLSKA